MRSTCLPVTLEYDKLIGIESIPIGLDAHVRQGQQKEDAVLNRILFKCRCSRTLIIHHWEMSYGRVILRPGIIRFSSLAVEHILSNWSQAFLARDR
ncbi:hypothetical protein NDU88_002465 [Pleurodeles waltl]|uniref:Uncharacterized protein n=1 Tax=Pleurodeles waltl TaxID=8319 RepID=A0AAV7NE28_PLEWA|nr:hypothetical protein NDU88_002465 [Pleurodeles waltl]